MATKIRVLQLIDRLGPGGAEALLVTLASCIDRAHFDLHVLALRPCPDSEVAPRLRRLGIPVAELNHRGSYDLPALIAVMRYIRRHRIDIVHTHLLAADVTGRVAGFLTRRPVVSTIHNCRTDLDKEPYRRQWMERWTARMMCQRLVAVSELLREETAAWFGLPLHRVDAITNGIDTLRFQQPAAFDAALFKQSLLGGDFLLVTNVARLVPQKAQHHLLEAARVVIAARPDVRFLLVGDGPLRSTLEAQVARGLGGKVIFAGSRSDIPDVLAATDVFALSSLWEGLPLTLIEALAAGCPVVATNVGGVPQVIRDGVTGLLVPPANPAALAAAILECLRQPARARQFGAQGQTLVSQQFGMRDWARKLESLYTAEVERGAFVVPFQRRRGYKKT